MQTMLTMQGDIFASWYIILTMLTCVDCIYL
jgi:hypothetical protein